MTSRMLDGREASENVLESVAKRLRGMQATRPAHLAALLVGDDTASHMYVRKKKEAAENVGMKFTLAHLRSDASLQDVQAVIEQWNADQSVDGILVQLPLPVHLPTQTILDCISIAKDVDGLTTHSFGALAAAQDGFVPATAKAMLHLIRLSGVSLEGAQACVVGRGVQTGKPAAFLLLNAGSTITICHSKTVDLPSHTRRADILVSCVGKPGIITGSHVKQGAVVVDAGISKREGKTVGDVDATTVSPIAGWLTPVPGGVGPLTVAMLIENTCDAFEKRKR